MMKTSGRVLSCCVALFFALTSVSAVQRLNSINDLKQINFGNSMPWHSLVLLNWFAHTVHIDRNDVITMTFDPNNGDYGSHHYGNFEQLLVPLRRGTGYSYYTIGNLYQEMTMPLPPYVLRSPGEYVGDNRDRIIIRTREQNIGRTSQRIDQVYITQHYGIPEGQGTPYDPDHTYLITTNLLREIREFSMGGNQHRLLDLRNRYRSDADDFQLRRTWGDLACLGLLLCIVIRSQQYNYNASQPSYRPQSFRQQSYRAESYRPERSQNDWDCATICFIFIIVCVIIIITALKIHRESTSR